MISGTEAKMKELKKLIRRDCRILKARAPKRIAILLAVLVAIAVMAGAFGKTEIFIKGITGETAELVRENLKNIPVLWIMIKLGGVFVLYDFVYDDLYYFSSGLFARLGRRKNFWRSKILTTGCTCLLLSLLLMLVNMLVFTVFAGGMSRESLAICTASLVYDFVGIYTGACVFHLASCLGGKAVGFLLTLLLLCCGMFSGSGYLLINHIMPARTSEAAGMDLIGVIYGIAIICIVVLAGDIAISKKDFLNHKEV